MASRKARISAASMIAAVGVAIAAAAYFWPNAPSGKSASTTTVNTIAVNTNAPATAQTTAARKATGNMAVGSISSTNQSGGVTGIVNGNVRAGQ